MSSDHSIDHLGPGRFEALRDICGEDISPRLSRRSLFGAAGAMTAATFAPEILSEAVAQAPATLPERGELVIRNAYLVTMDPALGDIPRGDIHVRNGEIVAVGANLAVASSPPEIDAARMIAMPGFVETHWHCWNSLQRNWLTPASGYMATKNATAKHYAPLDFYNADRLAFAEAINAGITTVYNYAHNVISPEHAAAEMKAHADAGIRGIYGFGSPDLLPEAQPMDIAALRRAHQTWAGGASRDKDLVRLGVSLRGPRSTTPDVFDAEMKAAKDLGLPIIFHGGQSARASVSTAELKAKGYLTPDLTLVHFVLATQADRDNMAAAGVSLSYTVHGELRVRAGNAGEQLLHMIASGVNVCLSFDANSISPVDMFSSMCLAWDLGAPKDGTSTEKLNAVDFRQVIEMATIKGARAMGYDKLVGSLTPGKKADLILVRADDLNMVPFANVDCALVRAANAANVDTVFVDGRLMKRGGKLVGIDTQAVIRAAAMSAHQVRKRAGGTFTPASDTIPTY